MELLVKPKHATFKHAGELDSRFDTHDPRSISFSPTEVSIDLREIQFVRPAAALWCLTYLALASARGASCRLLVPTNMGVCIHLNSIGLFQILKELGVEVDDRDIRESRDDKAILPITRFSTVHEAEEITNQAFDNLQRTPHGAANLTSVVTELFGELAQNAAQHSDSEIGAFGCVQFMEFKSGARFSCAVADGGIGVLASLSQNPKIKSRITYDWDALELAVRERVSGTGDPHRGIGLYGVSEDVRHPYHSLLLHSGIGSLEINEEVESAARRTRLYPGTLAFLSIPT